MTGGMPISQPPSEHIARLQMMQVAGPMSSAAEPSTVLDLAKTRNYGQQNHSQLTPQQFIPVTVEQRGDFANGFESVHAM